MARTNKIESDRIAKFKKQLIELINEKNLDVNDFNFDQDSDSLELLILEVEDASGGADNANESTGSEEKEKGSQAQKQETPTSSAAAVAAEDIEAVAREKAGDIVDQAVKDAKIITDKAADDAESIVAAAIEQAGQIVNNAKQPADTDKMAGDIDPDSPAVQKYRNTGKVKLFTEGGHCNPNGSVMLTEDEAGSYQGLELCGEDGTSEEVDEDSE